MADLSQLNVNNNDYNLKDASARTALLAKADKSDIASTQTATGNPLTLTDAAPINAESLVVELEPKQDLHGQSAPYVGGSGKNLVDYAAFSESSIVSVALDKVYDDAGNCIGIKFNGTSTSDAYLRLNADVSGLPEVQGKLNFSIDGASFPGEVGVDTTDSTYPPAATAPNTDVTITDLSKVIRLWVYLYTGRTFDNVILKPMIRLSTETDPTFAPYSNICPITGYTECEVDDVGFNQNDEVYENGLLSVTNGSEISGTGIRSKNYNACIGGEDYYLYKAEMSASKPLYIFWFDENKAFISNGYKESAGVVTSPSNARFFRLRADVETTSVIICINISKTEGTPKNGDYVPYHSSNATIQFGQTVYGGEVDFLTGVLTVDRAFEVFDGSNDEGWVGRNENKSRSTSKLQGIIKNASSDGVAVDFIKSNMFTKSTADNAWMGYANTIGVGEDGIIYTSTGETMSISDWTTYLVNNNLQICYELAEPFTIQLTPQELKLLKGTNNITTNGTTINLGYQPDNVIGDVKGEIQAITEMDYLKILDNNVETPINNYRIYYHLISGAYTLVNMSEMLNHRFIFVEVVQNPSGGVNKKVLHSALVDPRTIDGFEYIMKASGNDNIWIESILDENKFNLSLRTTGGSYSDGDPTDYYVTIRMVD